MTHWLLEWLPALLSPATGGAMLCGFVIGWLICFTGVGGGVLVVPALAFFFDLPVSAAIGTASLYTAATKLLAGVEHVRIKNINYPLLVKIAAPALPALALAAFAINFALREYPDAGGQIQTALRYLVIGAICLSLFFALRGGGGGQGAATGRGGATAMGAGIGLIMGATGVGGGVLIAPALLLHGETAKRVVGTSILIALILSSLAAVFYAAGGQVDVSLALFMVIGSAAAIPLASRVLRSVSDEVVKKSLVGLIALAIILMLA